MAEETVKRRKPIGYKPIALDGGYGWFVVLGSFLIHVFTYGFVYSFGPIARSLSYEFYDIDVILILSLLSALMLATGPVASAICNRIGCRNTTIIGAIIASIGYDFSMKSSFKIFSAISYYTTTYFCIYHRSTTVKFLVFSIGIIMSTGFGLMYYPAIVIVTMYFERYRTLAMGVTVCGARVGTFVFSNVIPFLINSFGWRTVFIIYAGLVLLCIPCAMLFRPIEFEPIYDDEEEEMIEIKKNGKVDHQRSLELHRQEPIAEEDEDKASPHLTEDKKEPRMMKKMIDLSLFTDPVFLLFAFSSFLTTIGFIPPIFIRFHAEWTLGFSTSDADITDNAYGLASFFGLIVFSLVGDRALPFKYGKDRARNRLWIYSLFLMISGVASAFVFLISYYYLHSMDFVYGWMVIIYCFIFGFFIISYEFTSVILVDLIGIERFTNAFGLLLLVRGIATFVGSRVCGNLDTRWNYHWIFTFCGICLFLSGIILLKKLRNEVGFKYSTEKHGKKPLLH